MSKSIMTPQGKDIAAVIRQALTRYERGKAEHGQLDLARDNRGYIDEAIEELMDCINYCVFQILKIRGLKIEEKA